MKRIVNFLAIIALSFVTVHIANADGNTTSLPKKTERLDRKILSDSNSPRILGDLFIACYYNKESIEIEFPADVDYMEVTIANGSVVLWSSIITSDTPSCDIPYLNGEYTITCTTDSGAVYQGILSL